MTMMKKIRRSLLPVCCLVWALLGSCSIYDSPAGTADDADATSPTAVVHLNFSVNKATQTRALSSANENTVSDLTVLIFDGNGDVIGRQYKGSLQSTVTSGISLNVTTRVASGCTIYAFANLGSDTYFDGKGTKAEVDAMRTTAMTDLTALGSANDAIMFGNLTGVNIVADGTNTNKFQLPMAHVCSKLALIVKPTVEGITITGYQLCNIPKGSYLTDIARTTAAYPDGYSRFAAATGLNITTATTPNTASATYYIYENLAGNMDIKTESDRFSSVISLNNPAYVIVSARSSDGVTPAWQHTFRIYLGGVTHVTSGTPVTDYGDFNIYRNYSYTCTITISGSGDSDVHAVYTAKGGITAWGDGGTTKDTATF